MRYFENRKARIENRKARIENRKARIEIIPMIDIMLFLLVFFAIVTLRYDRRERHRRAPAAKPHGRGHTASGHSDHAGLGWLDHRAG